MGSTAFVFKGHFERHGPDTWAVCDHAPVFASGDEEESALSNIEAALIAYLRMLSQHDEIDAAVAAGKLVKIALTSSSLSNETKRLDSRFEAILRPVA